MRHPAFLPSSPKVPRRRRATFCEHERVAWWRQPHHLHWLQIILSASAVLATWIALRR